MSDLPERVVSLVPSWTETLFELGAGDRLVGATRYCVEPAEGLRSVARVGGTKNPKLEKIAELEPDLVLVNTEENRAEDIDWLRSRFAVYESIPRTVRQAAATVRELGKLLGAEREAGAILLEIEAQIARGEAEALTHGTVRVLYAIWKKPWMSVSRDTYIHDVLSKAGATNVTANWHDRYPELSPDDWRDLRIELVILPDEPWEFEPDDRDELAASGALDPGCDIALVDGKDFCWHGARTARGLGRVLDCLAPFRALR